MNNDKSNIIQNKSILSNNNNSNNNKNNKRSNIYNKK